MARVAAWAFGKDLTGATSVEEALKKAELDFEVQKQKIYNSNGIEIPGWFANTRTDDKSVLGIVTDKYKIVQNIDAFNFVDNLVHEGMQFEKGGVFHYGKSAWVEAKLPGDYKILGDDVESHVVFINSHDGKGAVKVCMTPLRLACSNQLVAALKGAERKWSVVHSSKIDERIAEARETLGLAEAYMKALNDEAERLALKKMDDHEFIKILSAIYPVDPEASERKKVNVAETKNGILRCLEAPDVANFRNTAYGKFMAISDYATHRESQRLTAQYTEARWEKLANGDPEFQKLYEAIAA